MLCRFKRALYLLGVLSRAGFVVRIARFLCVLHIIDYFLHFLHRSFECSYLSFKLHHPVGARVVRVVVYVNGKRKLSRSGRNITRVSIARLPKKRFVVRIVATQNTGAQIISTRVYDGCKKSRPTVRHGHV